MTRKSRILRFFSVVGVLTVGGLVYVGVLSLVFNFPFKLAAAVVGLVSVVVAALLLHEK